ncbi:SusC/RagA family TonB-linked outer membrane protein, partial [Prevotella bivia]|uniref:SusC/RagA family TonB-linked outer membrane protein n=1 Tax=Prevotella bivia TaxID=28125 RepID=UPI00254D8BE2
SEPGNGYTDIHGDAINPVRILCASNAYNKTSDMWSTTSLQLHDIVPGLKFTSRFSFNIENNFYKEFNPMRPESGKPQLFNEMNESAYRYKKWMTENTLTYDNAFGKHNLGLLLSTTANKLVQRGVSVYARGFSDETPALQYLAYAGTTTPKDYLIGPDANVACIARASYSYDDRYFLTASWRRDYAGRLPKDNNYGDFPAFTGAWKISNESWFPKNKNLNLLKLRASWGRVGNLGSIGYGYKAAQLSSSVWSEGAQYGVTSNTLWGTLIYNGTALNPSLTWETSEQWDLGLDATMFNNRLSLGFDYFNKRTYNLIQQQSVGWPSTIGLDAMLVNLGEVKNEGVEVQAAWNDQVNKDFSYYINGNFAWLKNRVTDTGTHDENGNPGIWVGDVYGHNDFKTLTNLFQTTQGQALNSFHLIKTDGIFQSDEEAAAYVDKDGKRIQPNAKAGDLKFVDANNDGKIDDKDRQYCGSSMPKTTYALTAGFNWKGLSVSAMFQGVSGAQALFVGKALTLSDTEGNFNRWNKILDAWSPENRGSDIPRISKNDPNGNFTTSSDWYLEDASYLRLKNLTIGYDFTDFIQKWGHLNDRKSSLYVYFSAENVFTITKYSGMDPEVGGFDTMKYPLSRVFSLGVKITY